LEFEEGSICKNIGKYAFYYCEKLQSITIPLSIISIGDYAFSNCSKLTNIYYCGTTKDQESIVFSTSKNKNLTSATWHYYSENTPQDILNSYWRYVNKVPTTWELEENEI
jgi:hypothetical protein